MAKEAKHLRRLLIALVAALGLMQWAVVLERTCAAIWAWYKFFGYGGGGHIVVGITTQTVFLSVSAVLVAVGYSLFKAESATNSTEFWSRLSRFGWLSMAACTLFWTALLLSPIVTFQRAG